MIAGCNIVIEPKAVATPSGPRLPNGGPLVEGGGPGGGWDAANLQSAYKIPTTGGSGEVVAIVDAYGYPGAESDLKKYREQNKLYYNSTETACTKANGCFKQVNQEGKEENYPPSEGTLEKEWSMEQALDMDMVSAACPKCTILLVEATTQSSANTAASAEEAAKLKATEISNSYGYGENEEGTEACPSKKGCKEYLAAYDHSGVPVTVSAGDSAYDDDERLGRAPNWPATSPNVIAVGGTVLTEASNSRGWEEKVWDHTGSGCSLYEIKPTWQTDKGCSNRTDNDVAAVAENVSIYNTPEAGGWTRVGGTSAGAPLIAGIEAHASSATKTLAAHALYIKPSMLFHISEGNNEVLGVGCGSETSETYYLCHATKEGYNGPTGEGTPDGVFNATPAAATGSASSVTGTGATLHGTVNPSSLETKYYFEYGTTTSYGSKTAEASAGSGTSSLEESKAITGLTPSTTYHFRIVATNSEGTTDGLDETFTTAAGPKPPKAETKAATSVAETGATLNGAVDPEGSETKYYFEYGTTESYGTKTAEASAGSGTSYVEESKAITGLTANTTYYFRIVATNGGGTADGASHVLTTTGWVLMSTPNPSGVPYSALYGISCTSSSACTAVGTDYNSEGTNFSLAERWSGKEWTIQETPNPSGTKSSILTDVSCASSEACMAVGENEATGEGYLAERWNGKEWSPTQSESGGADILTGVSCTSTTNCIAVGEGGSSGDFAEGWNGKEWSAENPPKPTGGTSIYVSGVSCSSSAECTLVGSYDSGTEKRVTLAERWNGKEWAIQETPTPSEGKYSYLTGVSCTSATACIASGYHETSEGGWTPFAESWNGKEWLIQTMSAPKATNTYLEGVSCTSATACTAVGESEDEALQEGWNGKEWVVQTAAKISGALKSVLDGVSCTSATACTAVGVYENSSKTKVTLAEVYE